MLRTNLLIAFLLPIFSLGVVLAQAQTSGTSWALPSRRSVCVWHEAESKCVWNLMYPFSSVLDPTSAGSPQQQSDAEASAAAKIAVGGLSATARSLLDGSLRLDWCFSRGRDGPDACTAAPTIISPASNASASWTCQWYQEPPAALTPLLTQLFTGPSNDSNSSSAQPMCLPAAVESLLAPYLALIAPERCSDFLIPETCFQDPRCFYEDHFDHGDCNIDVLYVAKILSEPQGDLITATPPLPQASLSVHHRCSPESNWPDAHSARPAPLSRAECLAQGEFSPDRTSMVRLAVAAGVPVPAVAMPVSSEPPPPTAAAQLSPPTPFYPSPASPNNNIHDHDDDDHDHGPDVHSDEEHAHEDDEGVHADEEGSAEDQHGSKEPKDVVVVAVAPACRLEAPNLCVPSLLGFAEAAAGVTTGEAQAAAVHAAMAKDSRELFAAARAALACIHSTGLDSSSSSTSSLSPVRVPANTTAACVQAALAGSPQAFQALTDVFNPPCNRLSTRQCTGRSGCFLEPHGDHYDCKRTSTYASDFLIPQPHQFPTAVDSAAAVLASAVQRLATSCRTSVTSCSQRQVNMTVSYATISGLATAAQGPGALDEGEAKTAGYGETLPDLPASPDGTDGTRSPAAPTGGDSAGAHDHDDHDEDPSEAQQRSKELRIGSVFVVLVAGLVGCAIPVVMRKWLERRPLVMAGLRAVSAGLILCLALVHIASHAVTEMSGLVEGGSGGEDGHAHRRLSARRRLHRRLLRQEGHDDVADYGSDAHDHHEGEDAHGGAHDHPFPIGMVTVVFGYLLMVGMEHVTHVMIERYGKKSAEASAVTGPGTDEAKSKTTSTRAFDTPAAGGAVVLKVGTASSLQSLPTETADTSRPADTNPACPTTPLAEPCSPPKLSHSSRLSSAAAVQPTSAVPACCTRLPYDHSPSYASHGQENFRLAGMAFLFELGCVFHSFIIGLMLGTTTDYSEAATLLIALSFHQLLEGIGLAAVLVSAMLGIWRLVGMVVLYALTCPIGIAVGISISDSYDSHTVTARAVQGTLNGVSAGLLLYLASVMIGCDFGSAALARWRPWERIMLFGLMCAAAGAFAVLALWA